MRQVHKSLALVALTVAAWPGVAWAHVKWFTDGGQSARPYRLGDGPVMAWTAACAAIVAVGLWLERRLPVPRWLASRQATWGPMAVSVVTLGGGAALVMFSVSGFLLAPNMPATGAMGTLSLAVQAVAGLMLMLGMHARLGGALLAALFVILAGQYGVDPMLDALEMLGLAMFAIMAGRPRWGLTPSSNLATASPELAMPVLRVMTGLNLMVLGFSEKILAPGLADEFLGKYAWNFLASFGVSDYWFAFSAGVTEALIGLFLVLGLVTRVTTLVLAVFLATTLVLLGPIELLGHLPHFSIAVGLLVVGAGSRLKAAYELSVNK